MLLTPIANVPGQTPFALPSVSDQFAAVLSAPLPFFLALAAVLIPTILFIWRAMEWRYGGIIEIWQTRHTQAVGDFEIARRREGELEKTVNELKTEVATLREEAKDIAKLQPSIDKVAASADVAGRQLTRLGEANTALAEVLGNVPIKGIKLLGRGSSATVYEVEQEGDGKKKILRVHRGDHGRVYEVLPVSEEEDQKEN